MYPTYFKNSPLHRHTLTILSRLQKNAVLIFVYDVIVWVEEKGAKKNTTVNNNQVENLDSVIYNWLKLPWNWNAYVVKIIVLVPT